MKNQLDVLTNLIMDNYDVYDTKSIENFFIKETVELMMNNWRGVTDHYKEWRINKCYHEVLGDTNARSD